MQTISSLKTYFDEIEETKGDDECRAWLSRVLDAKLELATFVATHRGRGRATEYVGFLKGSFNFSLRFKFSDDGPDAIIRFPKLGHTATTLCDEKVTNEVQAMDYLTEHTTIPIPRIYSWGLTADSPHQLGPFIIMDFVPGILLSKVLKQPTDSDQDAHVLDPNIDDAKLDKIYGQIADYLLQLSTTTHPKTLEIPAVLDLEFTNAMPAQFSYDPPSWLLLSGPESWLDRGALGEFRDLYMPRMEQFLRVLELVEARADPEARRTDEPLLSARMRDSWSSGRFWFDYAARKSFDMDAVYWAALHDQGDGIDHLDEEARGELGPFVDEKMGQLREYRNECAALFSSTSG